MLKKISTILFFSFLFVSSINYTEATFIDSLVEAAKPDRATPWMLFDQPNIQFNEYHISALNRACGFRAFGYASRDDAIDTMLNALTDIDEQYEMRNVKLRSYIENDCGENVENYLTSLKNEEYELPYTMNRYINTDIDKMLEEYTYTLINAFALLNNVSLCIYEEVKDEPKTISLTHSFVCGQSDEVLHLLCRGLHYNKLVFTFDENANQKAQIAENDYLNELRFSYEPVLNNQRAHPIVHNFVHNITNLPDHFNQNDQNLYNNYNNIISSSNSENTHLNIIDEYMGQGATDLRQTQVEPSYPGYADLSNSVLGQIPTSTSNMLYSHNPLKIEPIHEGDPIEDRLAYNVLGDNTSDYNLNENDYVMNIDDNLYHDSIDFID